MTDSRASQVSTDVLVQPTGVERRASASSLDVLVSPTGVARRASEVQVDVLVSHWSIGGATGPLDGTLPQLATNLTGHPNLHPNPYNRQQDLAYWDGWFNAVPPLPGTSPPGPTGVVAYGPGVSGVGTDTPDSYHVPAPNGSITRCGVWVYYTGGVAGVDYADVHWLAGTAAGGYFAGSAVRVYSGDGWTYVQADVGLAADSTEVWFYGTLAKVSTGTTDLRLYATGVDIAVTADLGGPLDATLPKLTGSFDSRGLAATLPKLTGLLQGRVDAGGDLAGVLPQLTGAFTGNATPYSATSDQADRANGRIRTGASEATVEYAPTPTPSDRQPEPIQVVSPQTSTPNLVDGRPT